MSDYIDNQKLFVDLCKKYHIQRLSLFGSILRNDFHAESDVDVLVEFEPDHIPGFIELGTIEDEISAIFDGRKIDLVTPKFLNHRIRDKILREAQILYGK